MFEMVILKIILKIKTGFREQRSRGISWESGHPLITKDPGFSVLHVEVSLGRTLNLKLLPMLRLWCMNELVSVSETFSV